MTQTPPSAPRAAAAGAASRPTSRIVLTRVRRADGADLARANLASTAVHRPWIRPFTDEAGFLAWFQSGMTGAHVHLVARTAAGGAPVSVVSFENIVAGALWNAHLSYYAVAGFTGGGWQTEAVRAALALSFSEIGLHRVEAAVQPANAPSRALLQRLGFRCEGLSADYLHVDGAWRDHERWALLRREFTG